MRKVPTVLTAVSALLLLLLCCAPAVKADQLTFNLSGSASRFPFGTDGDVADQNNYQAGAAYQQLYSRAAFPDRVRLTEAAFASAPSIGTPGVASFNFVLRLGTAATSVAAVQDVFEANRGVDLLTVFAGPLTYRPRRDGTFDFVISFNTPFDYDPRAGDLLLDVVTGAPTGYTGGALYFIAGASDEVSSVFSTTASPVGIVDEEFSYGLRTRFTFTSAAAATPVPEPATILLLGAGLGACGARAYKRRRV